VTGAGDVAGELAATSSRSFEHARRAGVAFRTRAGHWTPHWTRDGARRSPRARRTCSSS